MIALLSADTMGLSPRLRGNRMLRRVLLARIGSIPAPAGEPQCWTLDRRRTRVYPRACGGTMWATFDIGVATGLSPRLRGNRRLGKSMHSMRRSIPAPAGEPQKRAFRPAFAWVYPRACGGTSGVRRPTAAGCGLSPRLRGNLENLNPYCLCYRSIPAPAGEPYCQVRSMVQGKVYPRACGGTPNASTHSDAPAGLSPRLRGNPNMTPSDRQSRRSIPAPAGEPISGGRVFRESRVYPRACGGTPPLAPC